MANNISMLNENLKEKAKADAERAAETFEKNIELTPEEQAAVEKMNKEREVVVTEVAPNGAEISTPLEDYAASVDEKIKEISTSTGNTLKGINVGDIKVTAEDMKRQARDNAIKAFRQLSISGDENMTDEHIMEINAAGLEAVKNYLKVDRLESGDAVRKLRRLSTQELARILPDEFVQIYATAAEIKANNYKAKERLLTSIEYLTVTGPELDYLNDYIDHEHKLMMLQHRLVECQTNIADVLQSKEKLGEIAAKAEEISPQDTSIWNKLLIGDPKRVHNSFAQRAIICTVFREAYEKLHEEYANDPECQAEIWEQIKECDTKYNVYRDITNLTLFKELWATLTERLKGDRRGSYKNLVREANSALDRIRRAKQNVPFPAYDPSKVKRPDDLFTYYMVQFSSMVLTYNAQIDKGYSIEPDQTAETAVCPVRLDDIPDTKTAHYFTLLLLVLYGRIMKRLSGSDITKYDAIMLDSYFTIYCQMGTDIYLMSDIWNIMKEFVEYAIKTWPTPEIRRKK